MVDPKLSTILRNQLGDPRSHFGWGCAAMMVILITCIFYQ